LFRGGSRKKPCPVTFCVVCLLAQESEVSFISVEFRWEEAPKPDVTRQAGNVD
jgi:hypothetical protein